VVKWNLLIRHGTGWATAYSISSPSLNQWYCVELHWKKDTAAGIGELWVDGKKVCSVTGKNTAYYGGVNRVEDGLPEILNCAATTVYSDCVKVSNAYIGPEPTTTMFANGFESGSFSAWTGGGTTAGETRAVTTELKYAGSYSARFKSNGTGGTESAYCYKTITARSNLYARGYFRVSTNGATGVDDRFYFIVFRAGGTDVAYAGWRRTSAGLRWVLVIRNGSSSTVTLYSSSAPSTSTWYRIELHWKLGTSTGLAELFVNGVRVCYASGKNTAYYGSVTSVRIGLPTLVNCASTKIYADNVALSTAYIGP
jgi:hypothetical protein